ncbi:hypothetical protein ACWEKM_31380 [Streptomyces sp. NPDC004752]
MAAKREDEQSSHAVGGAHGVGRDQDTGTFSGGADPRRDGVALAW